jgi:hypothetical protein
MLHHRVGESDRPRQRIEVDMHDGVTIDATARLRHKDHPHRRMSLNGPLKDTPGDGQAGYCQLDRGIPEGSLKDTRDRVDSLRWEPTSAVGVSAGAAQPAR